MQFYKQQFFLTVELFLLIYFLNNNCCLFDILITKIQHYISSVKTM